MYDKLLSGGFNLNQKQSEMARGKLATLPEAPAPAETLQRGPSAVAGLETPVTPPAAAQPGVAPPTVELPRRKTVTLPRGAITPSQRTRALPRIGEGRYIVTGRTADASSRGGARGEHVT